MEEQVQSLRAETVARYAMQFHLMYHKTSTHLPTDRYGNIYLREFEIGGVKLVPSEEGSRLFNLGQFAKLGIDDSTLNMT